VERAEALMPVRSRLIKAVFFLSAESRDLLVVNTSVQIIRTISGGGLQWDFVIKGVGLKSYQFHPPKRARSGHEAPLD
jgi:hypothetical protein